MIDQTIDYYNKLKEKAGYETTETVKNKQNVFTLSECTRDEGIDSVIEMFYNPDHTFEEIKKTRTDEYIKRYRRLLFLETEFIMQVSDSTAETFTRFIRAEKQHDNYILINSYFSGFKIGSKLMKEFDNIYKEMTKENTKENTKED